MRLAVDATPLLGQRSGVGRYVEGVLTGLSRLEHAPQPMLALFHPGDRVPDPLPPGTRRTPRAVPQGLLLRAWERLPLPRVETLTGPIDVFHGGNYTLPRMLWAASVVTIHDLTYLRYRETVDDYVATYRERVPVALQRASRTVTVSEAVRQELVAEYRLDPARVVVAPNGVDTVWFDALPLTPADRHRLGVPARYLLFIGNREPRKGLPTLVEAHRRARRADPAVPMLVLVGPSGWGDVWGEHPPDRGDVVQTGFVSESDLRGLVAGAVAVCMPSRYEGFGLPILEALACARPVLASDIAAHREVGGDEVRYLPVGDVDAWAHAMGELSAGGTESGAEAARLDRARPFTWERSARIHLHTWQSAAAERRGRRR
jgi:glycosyltransferase involved in cell wall biosynthesis